jgi:hypothetical protein
MRRLGEHHGFTVDTIAPVQLDGETVSSTRIREALRAGNPRQAARLRAWAFEGGPPVAHEDYYLRAQPIFETPKGKHDWMTRHVFVGVGERRPDGNFVRYFALT